MPLRERQEVASMTTRVCSIAPSTFLGASGDQTNRAISIPPYDDSGRDHFSSLFSFSAFSIDKASVSRHSPALSKMKLDSSALCGSFDIPNRSTISAIRRGIFCRGFGGALPTRTALKYSLTGVVMPSNCILSPFSESSSAY